MSCKAPTLIQKTLSWTVLKGDPWIYHIAQKERSPQAFHIWNFYMLLQFLRQEEIRMVLKNQPNIMFDPL